MSDEQPSSTDSSGLDQQVQTLADDSYVGMRGCVPARLGDFRILREIGRGGMGIVFEAVQESLGRRVALKILPQSIIMADRQRQRFEREARAAAQLHHTNIVPIFGVGEQGGISYYVMQFIEGQPLDAVMTELRRQARERSGTDSALVRAPAPCDADQSPHEPLPDSTTVDRDTTLSQITAVMHSGVFGGRNPAPSGGAESDLHESSSGFSTDFLSLSAGDSAAASGSGRSGSSGYFRSVARIGHDVADALQHAFDQKVTHRDIKPANLILDVHGAVWVTDFGLAKFHEGPAVTQPGDVVGTLRYMAPEALEGKGDVRADICSLGLTLYELLVLRPAHDAAERRALLQQIASQTPIPLRRLNPRIPRDMETIISKAIACDPADRYQTPGAMASDLARFLNDEPIAARRTPVFEQLVRWARKHPGLASATGAAALLAILLVVASVLWWRAAESRSVAIDALNRRQKAELEDQARRLGQANKAAILMQSFLKPMVERARLSQQAERRSDATEQMRAIAVAVQNFDAVHHRLPADIVAADGTPLLSWRVEILPFLPDQAKLAEQFRRNEPWDSPHNKALLSDIPDWYAPVVEDNRADALAEGIEVARRASRVTPGPEGGFQPGQGMEELQLDLTRRMVDFMRRESAVTGTTPKPLRVNRIRPVTFYQAFHGPTSLIDGQRHLSLTDVTDGTNNTILLVESADPVPWTKPGGLNFDPAGPLPRFGGLGFPGVFGIAMLDGSVHLVERDISPDLLKKMITPRGCEEVPLEWDTARGTARP